MERPGLAPSRTRRPAAAEKRPLSGRPAGPGVRYPDPAGLSPRNDQVGRILREPKPTHGVCHVNATGPDPSSISASPCASGPASRDDPETLSLSFVLPAHNEAAFLPNTLAALRRAIAAVGLEDRSEIIVVADASTDDTGELAAASGARVLRVAHRQIAATLNAGAVAASGEVLIFLDADTVLPAETLRAALEAIRHGAVAGGALVRLDEVPDIGAAFGQRLWNCLSRVFRWAAGCFLFTRREAFAAVGGFNTRYYAAEEIALSHALKRCGPFTILPRPVITSARKLTDYPFTAHLWLAVKTLLTFGRTIRRREDLALWYEPGRGNGESEPDQPESPESPRPGMRT